MPHESLTFPAMVLRRVAAIFAATVLATSVGQAAVIASFGSHSGGGSITDNDWFGARVHYTGSEGTANPLFWLRAGSDTRSSHRWLLDSGPKFDFNAAKLADGISSHIVNHNRTELAGGSSSSSETSHLFGDHNDPRVDLHGYKISALEVFVENLEVSVGPHPQDSRHNWIEYSYDWRVDVHVVPLPSGLVLGLSGMALLGAAASRRKRQPR